MRPDKEMSAWAPEDPPRRPSFGADLFGFGFLILVILSFLVFA